MTRAALLIPDDLRATNLCGGPLQDSLALACAAVGLNPTVVSEDTPCGEGPLLIVNGRYPVLSSATLEPLRTTEGDVALVTPDGTIAAVRLVNPEPGLTVGQALELRRLPEQVIAAKEAIAVTDLWSLSVAERTIHRRRLRDLARSGVRIIDPDRVIIDLTVRIAPGCTLWPDIVLRGKTSLAAGAEVQSGCWLEDTEVGENAVIKPHSVCSGAQIGDGASVGPLAHLRPGAVLESDVKVGNFVEIKKSVLHEGAKASHLSYIGDADIGAGANIGAGTITCNYNGYAKARTVVGENAFVGTNTSLVAPVRVGDGAIVGAGSVITRDVPDNALAVERSEQRVLKNKASVLNERNRLAAERARGDD